MRYLWIVGLIACKGSEPGFTGTNMLDYFPFSQNKDCLWEYAHEDVLLEHSMTASMTNFEFIGDYEHFEISFVKKCRGDSPTCTNGDLIRRMNWSVQGNQGVLLHGFSTPTSNHVFDPPIRFADNAMLGGDIEETSTGGGDYVSTMVEIGECPTPLETFVKCAKFELETTNGVSDVVGTYWAINDFNIVAIDWPEQEGRWELIQHTEP